MIWWTFWKVSNFQRADVLVSFDVTSLFTRVPVPETLEVVESRLRELHKLDSDPVAEITSLSTTAIMDLLRYAMDDCYFTWDKVLLKQKSVIPMGGCLSLILAILFMESLKYSVLCSAPIIPRMFFSVHLWYTDNLGWVERLISRFPCFAKCLPPSYSTNGRERKHL